MARPRVALVIPAFNEAATIHAVVRSVLQFGTVVVVDDASSDGTGDAAERAGAVVLRNARNLQYDGSLDVALRWASDRGYEYAISMDADSQHDPDDIPKFIAAIEQGADLVSGIRPAPARIAEGWVRAAGRLLWGLEDPLCGMKAYRLSWFQRYGAFDTYRSIGTELAIRMACDGATVAQTGISVRARRGASRFDTSFKANLRILRALIIGCWRHRGAS
jgi:glycosyltransferase involved in cell wall biosynthesis